MYNVRFLLIGPPVAEMVVTRDAMHHLLDEGLVSYSNISHCYVSLFQPLDVIGYLYREFNIHRTLS